MHGESQSNLEIGDTYNDREDTHDHSFPNVTL